jgi:hypothetical protein
VVALFSLCGAKCGSSARPHLNDSGIDVGAAPVRCSQAARKMKGNHLALDCCAIGIGFPVQILIAVPSTQRFHCRHPKVVSVRAQDVDCLAEAKLDSKSISVEQYDFQRLEGRERARMTIPMASIRPWRNGPSLFVAEARPAPALRQARQLPLHDRFLSNN